MNRRDELRRLGDRIKAMRNKQFLTQSEFALRCGFNRNYIGMLERGERNPTYITLICIANKLGITVSQLIGEGDNHGDKQNDL